MEKEFNYKPHESEAMVDFLTGGPLVKPSAAAQRDWEQAVRRRAQKHVNAKATWWRWTAATGWAAALGLALWTLRPGKETAEVAETPKALRPILVQKKPASPTTRQPGVTQTVLVQELDKLQKEMAALRDSSATPPRPPRTGESRFSIFELSKDGKGKTSSQPTAFSSQRLAGYLHRGIEQEMDAARLAKSAGGETLVGPTYGSWDGKVAGSILVFPNFPQNDWEALGLLRGQSGVFYDPSRGLLWQPSPELPGTWKGLPVEKNSLLAEGLTQDPATSLASSEPSPAAAKPLVEPEEQETEPLLLVTVDQQTGDAMLIADNLPQLPAGQEYVVGVTDEIARTSIVLGSLDAESWGPLTASFSMTAFNSLQADGVFIYVREASDTPSTGTRFPSVGSSLIFNAGSAPFVTTTSTNP